MERYGSIESVLRAEIVELGAALDAEREKVKGLKKRLAEEHPGLDEVCDERDALRAQLAAAQKVKADYDRWLSGGVYFTTAEYEKHIAEHQAQLRQVEGERDGLEQNCLDNHAATEQAE